MASKKAMGKARGKSTGKTKKSAGKSSSAKPPTKIQQKAAPAASKYDQPGAPWWKKIPLPVPK